MIQEIIAQEDLQITFRVDSGYFVEDILGTIETLGFRYVIKGYAYPVILYFGPELQD